MKLKRKLIARVLARRGWRIRAAVRRPDLAGQLQHGGAADEFVAGDEVHRGARYRIMSRLPSLRLPPRPHRRRGSR